MLDAIHDLLINVAHAATSVVPTSLKPPEDPGGYCESIFSNGGLGRPGAAFECWKAFAGNLSFVIITFAASISLIMLIINGFRYMYGPAIPGGSSDAAKKGIGAALFGLALCLLSYVIVDTFIRALT